MEPRLGQHAVVIGGSLAGLMTARGLAEAGGMSVPLTPGRVRFRTMGTFKTTAPKLSWLNTTVVAFEGEGDFSSMEVIGKIYEWN